MERRLYRSEHNRVFLGVCGGFGEFFNVDPVIIRVITVLIAVFTAFFPTLIAYLVIALVIPSESSLASTPRDTFRENITDMRDTAAGMGEDIRKTFEERKPDTGNEPHPVTTPPGTFSKSSLFILGIIIIAIGVFFILLNFFGWFWIRLWPLWLIIAGLIIIVVVAVRRKQD